MLESWQVVELSTDIAESAARLRAGRKIKLPDAVQAASAIYTDALVTHDRDFSRVIALKVITKHQEEAGGLRYLILARDRF